MIRPFLCSRICVNTLFQLGLPAIVRDFRPVTRSRFSCNVQVLSIILLDKQYMYVEPISPRRILSLAHELPVYTFSWRRSNASCNPTAFMSVFCNAEVMYMCMSRKCPMTPSCSDCSISNCESNLTNHSNDFWSRFIQKKSTCCRKKEKK